MYQPTEKEKRARISYLKTARKFEKWLQKHGRRASFSTFVDEFGYQARDARLTYQAVQALRQTALAHAAKIPGSRAMSESQEPQEDSGDASLNYYWRFGISPGATENPKGEP